MYRDLLYLLLVITALSVGFSSADGTINRDHEIKPEDLAVNVTLDDGQHLEFPYYDPNIRQIDPDLREVLTRHRVELIAYVSKVVESELKKPGSTGFYGWLMVGKKIITMTAKHNAERRRGFNEFQSKKFYNRETNDMIFTAINDSIGKIHDFRDVPRKEFTAKFVAFSKAIQEAIKNSPVGPYLKFNNSYINNVKFTDLAVGIVAGLRVHGFENHIGLISGLLS